MKKKLILRHVGLWAIKGVTLVVRMLPLWAALAFGRALGSLMRRVDSRRYQVALKNLRIAFGDQLSDSERHRIACESFRHFGMFLVESLRFPSMKTSDVLSLLDVPPNSAEIMRDALSTGTGCILVGAHLGSFEIGARWLVANGYPLAALARGARDPGTTEYMLKLRERCGIRVITLSQSMKPIITTLRENHCLAILCDQNAGDVYVPFFGHLTGTADGPAKIALKTGASMLFMHSVRTPEGRYKIEVTDVYHPESTGDRDADVRTVMSHVNQQIEQSIRAYPEQWLWFHDRWRSSPDVRPATDSKEPSS